MRDDYDGSYHGKCTCHHCDIVVERMNNVPWEIAACMLHACMQVSCRVCVAVACPLYMQQRSTQRRKTSQAGKDSASIGFRS